MLHCIMPSHTLIRIRNFCVGIAPTPMDFLMHVRLAVNLFRKRKLGWPIPPFYLVKRGMLQAEGRRIQAQSFVETGTYLGDTTWHLRNSFPQVVTIEVEPKLAELARKRFRSWKNVQVITGDSATCLAEVAPRLKSPILFWLDGHYDAGITGRGVKDCPIWEELAAIQSRTDATFSILIDDARNFGKVPGYPTVESLQQWCGQAWPHHRFSVENDVIKVLCPL